MDQCAAEILGNSKIGIQPDVCNRIQSVLKESLGKPNTEIEARLGFIYQGKAQAGFPNADQKRWMWLLKIITDSDLYQQGKFSKTFAQLSDNNIRIEEVLTDNVPVTKVRKMMKSRLTLFDRVQGEYTIKIDLVTSEEIPTQDEPGSIQMTREKSRVTFFAKDASHSIEMTSTQESYEVEVEYFSKNIDLKTFFMPLKLIWASFDALKEKINVDTKVALRFFNNFFKQQDGAKFDESVLFKRGLPQPINLKRWNLNLSAYAVTKKLNGVRMIGIITDQKLFLAGMKGNIELFRSKIREDLDGTIFDCEFFKNQVHIFDMICLHDRDVRQLTLDKRFEYIEQLVNSLRDVDIIKKQFFMTYQIAEDTEQLLNEIRNNPNYDGLILTPIAEPYLNFHTYKWKPVHELTIDFAAVKVYGEMYNLMVGGKNGLIHFTPPGFRGTIRSKFYPPKIGEYRWHNGTFELVKARPDKTEPNYVDIAKDVWIDIQNPLTEQELINALKQSSDRDAFRKFSNTIKRELINLYCPERTILDLGSGKGGDLMKYYTAHVARLIAIEPNPEFLLELKQRASEMEFRNQRLNLIDIQARAQDTETIVKALRGSRVQVATSFFVLSFFFENEDPLNGLLQTLDESVEKNGYFLGTTIDGQATRRILEKGIVQLGNVTLKRLYQPFSGNILFNKGLEYQYKGSQTVAETQIEYLVDWEYFVEKMKTIGFKLEKSEMFSPPMWLDPEEQQLARLYRSFLFVRESYYPLTGFARGVKVEGDLALQPVDPGKNKVYSIVLEEKGLVRTGTLADGNDFFHALQTALSIDYRKMKDDEKKEFVKNWRKTVNIPIAQWKKVGEGRIARMGFGRKVPGFDSIVHYYLTNKNEGFLGRRANLVAMMGNQYQLEKHLLRLEQDKVLQSKMIEVYKKELENTFQLQALRKDLSAGGMLDLKKIFELAEQEAYSNFIDNLGTSGNEVGLEVLEILSEFIRHDIYLLDEDGKPIPVDCSYTEGRPSIVLVSYRDNNHYETVGRVGQGNVIHRIFGPNDPLIKGIRNKIC